MKYLLMDQSMFLKMMVAEQKDRTFMQNFLELLSNGEIKLVVPSLIKQEVYKVLEAEVEGVKESYHQALVYIDGLKSMENLTEGETPVNLEETKRLAKAPIQRALEALSQNLNQYKLHSNKWLKAMFEEANCLLITDDMGLSMKAVQRQISKKAPCHVDHSMAAAVLAEAFINAPVYINDLKAEDRVYLVTDQVARFSKSKQEERVLHPQIMNDIKRNEEPGQFKYIVSLKQLIFEVLSQEIDEAELRSVFEKELSDEEVARP